MILRPFLRFFAIAFFVLIGSNPFLLASVAPTQKPFLPGFFSDNMVLQRDTECPIWGWAIPGSKVTVSFHGQTSETVVGADGRWMVKIGPFPAGGPYDLTVSSAQTRTLKNILMGDVWLCSGQSNMGMGMNNIDQWWNMQTVANSSGIRLLTIPYASRFSPPLDIDTAWRPCKRDNVFSKQPKYDGFSAIAFLSGEALHRQTGVPIGLIECSWGATAIVSWSTPEAARRLCHPDVDAFAFYRSAVENAWREMDPSYDTTGAWMLKDFADDNWDTIDLAAANWKLRNNFSGVLWMRREIVIPPEMAGRNLTLVLGAGDQRDTIWWDGVFLDGSIPDDLDKQARYFTIPDAVATPGRHVLTLCTVTSDGVIGRGRLPELRGGDGPAGAVALTQWRIRPSTPSDKIQTIKRYPPRRDISAGCYQAMLAPLAPMAIKGFLWYQGEGDVGHGGKYYLQALSSMIKDWRTLFGSAELPFYLVQLSGFGDHPTMPGKGSGWAEVREAQAMVASQPHSGLAVSIDRGDIYNIHPAHKKDPAQRLAAVVLAKTYGQDVPWQGPTFDTVTVEGNALRVRFNGVDSGLVSKGANPTGFEIAGADGRYVWADAIIDGHSVILRSAAVPSPLLVRYGWADHPLCNLYNGKGLPAVPFRAQASPVRP